MAQEEVETVRSQMQSLETQLEILLLPKDPLDERSIMLEVLSTPERHCFQHSTQTTNPVPTADTCMCTTEGQFSLYPEMSGPILPASSMKQQCACESASKPACHPPASFCASVILLRSWVGVYATIILKCSSLGSFGEMQAGCLLPHLASYQRLLLKQPNSTNVASLPAPVQPSKQSNNEGSMQSRTDTCMQRLDMGSMIRSHE